MKCSIAPIIVLLLAVSCTAPEEHPAPASVAEPDFTAPGADVRVDGAIGPDGIFHYPPGSFFIRFPGMPVHDQSITPTANGPMVTDMFVYEAVDPVAYMVAYSKHDRTMILEAGETVLEAAIRGALDPLGIAEPRMVRPVTLNDHKGLRFQADNGELFMDSQVQLLDDRLYRVTVLAKGSYASPGNVEQFIGSFHYAPSDTQNWQDVFEEDQ